MTRNFIAESMVSSRRRLPLSSTLERYFPPFRPRAQYQKHKRLRYPGGNPPAFFAVFRHQKPVDW
jgi:hypothetical protein